MNNLSKEELEGWRNDIVTRKIFADLNERIDFIKEEWASNRFVENEEAYARGKIEGIREIFNVTFNE
jgi:hypothetical protein